MSSSPTTKEDSSTKEYRDAWSAIIDLIKRGDSWSGNERNCVFLNCGTTDPRFANAAAVTGLDFPDDSRSVATVDWDGDGDLDLWFRNRTAPRLRLMLNQSDRTPENSRFLAVDLEGTHGNRDGIGARVEVKIADQLPLVRTLQAGEAFLSQSSKTLHFGLGAAQEIHSVLVRWPGGKAEQFVGLEPDGRYLLREGEGTAEPVPSLNRVLQLAAQDQVPPPDEARAAVLLPRRVPLPPLSYRKIAGSPELDPIARGDKPLLLLLWASWCPACRAEMKELSARRAEVESAGLEILALAMDGLNASSSDVGAPIAQVLKDTAFPYPHGYATKEMVDTFRVLEERLFDRHADFAVPYGFLLNAQRDLIAIYRGRMPPEVLLFDARNASATDDELRDLALPFPGRWYTRPYARYQMLEHFADLTARGSPRDGLHYLEQAVSEAPAGETRAAIAGKLAIRHYQFGYKLMADQTAWDEAIEHFNRSLVHNPKFAEAYHARGALEGNQGKLAAARASLEKALTLNPGDPEVQRKLEILSRTQGR